MDVAGRSDTELSRAGTLLAKTLHTLLVRWLDDGLLGSIHDTLGGLSITML